MKMEYQTKIFWKIRRIWTSWKKPMQKSMDAVHEKFVKSNAWIWTTDIFPWL